MKKFNFHNAYDEREKKRKKAIDNSHMEPFYVFENEYGEYATASGDVHGSLTFGTTNDINKAWTANEEIMVVHDGDVLANLDMTMAPLYIGRVNRNIVHMGNKPLTVQEIKDDLEDPLKGLM